MVMTETPYRVEYVEALTPTEDLIADRLGQWIASDRRDRELLLQAVALFRLAEELDLPYLDRRIREDTCGDLALEHLSGFFDENSDIA